MVLKELENDIINDSIGISTILRKAKILAYKLKVKEFKNWIDSELNGYDIEDEKKIPTYRKFHLDIFGHFMGFMGAQLKNYPIPTLSIKNEDRHYFTNEFFLTQGVKSIESLLEDEKASFNIPYTPDLLLFMNRSKIYHNFSCVSAWRVIPRSGLENVLDSIKNRLLTFVLELQYKYPKFNLSEDQLDKVSASEVTSMVNNYILGDSNILGSGSQITITDD